MPSTRLWIQDLGFRRTTVLGLRGRADRCGPGGLGKGPGPHRDEPSGEEPERIRQSERLLARALRSKIPLSRRLGAMDDLAVTSNITIPAGELQWRFTLSGGPGGQHANRSATQAELIFDLSTSSAFSPETKRHMIERLGPRSPEGVVTIAEATSRSQWRNRQKAKRRLAELLVEAMQVDRPRRPTRPGKAARGRRLEAKRRRSETKRLRRRPDEE